MKFSLFNSRKKLPLYETYNLSPVQTLCCAFFGVVTPRVIFTPFDSMRLLTDLHYKSGRRAIYKRVVENGIPSLWTGWICDIIRVPIQSGIRFLIFNHLKKYERKITSEKYHFFADSLSAAFAVTLSYPLEVIYTAMIYDPEKYPNIPKTALTLLRQDGIPGLFRGLTPTLYGLLPYRSFQVGAYYYLNKFSPSKIPTKSNTLINLTLGTAISAMAQASSYPFEVIRRRMIADPSVHGMTFSQVLKKTYQERGLFGCYRSFGYALARLIPMTCMQQWLTLELRKFVYNFNYQLKKHNF